VGEKTYDTVTVTGSGLKVEGQNVGLTYYFAPKVGMVKQVFDIGGSKVELELEKFEEPKK
jgi:hypothetical protein